MTGLNTAGARAASTDYLHLMRFWVYCSANAGDGLLGELSAGFSACSTPELTSEAVEYREGHYFYARKQPGLPTVADITLSRGVTLRDCAFWSWMRQTVEGSLAGEYRCNLSIAQWSRKDAMSLDAAPAIDAPVRNAVPLDQASILAAKARVYHVYQAFPIRHKVSGDLDATSSDIAVMELDVAYEYFDISIPAAS